MQIDNLVVSLETAKKLKAAGWSKPTAFVQVKHSNKIYELRAHSTSMDTYKVPYLPAPTAEEILRELPESIKIKRKPLWLSIHKDADIVGFFLSYLSGDNVDMVVMPSNKSLSEAAAQMWIWCKENNYLEGKK